MAIRVRNRGGGRCIHEIIISQGKAGGKDVAEGVGRMPFHNLNPNLNHNFFSWMRHKRRD
jgi:hypothetical protein